MKTLAYGMMIFLLFTVGCDAYKAPDSNDDPRNATATLEFDQPACVERLALDGDSSMTAIKNACTLEDDGKHIVVLEKLVDGTWIGTAKAAAEGFKIKELKLVMGLGHNEFELMKFEAEGGGNVNLDPILEELKELRETLANANKAKILFTVLTLESSGKMAEGVTVKVSPNTPEEQAFVTEKGVDLEITVSVGVTPKKFEIRAEKDGYGIKSTRVTVGAGDATRSQIVLQKVEEPEEGLVDRPDFAKALAEGSMVMCDDDGDNDDDGPLKWRDADGIVKSIPCDHLTLEVKDGVSVEVDPDNPTKLLFLDVGNRTVEFCFEGSGYDCKSFILTIY